MTLKRLPCRMSVCKLSIQQEVKLSGFRFTAATDEELSLVCHTEQAPDEYIAREDGWRMFRIEGMLDFSLVGILSGIAGILAENNIGIFAVSTYNTDYILVKEQNYDTALQLLADRGYEVL